MAVQRRDEALFVSGRLDAAEVKTIVKEAGLILADPQKQLALYVEGGQPNSEAVGLVLNKRLAGLAKTPGGSSKPIVAVAGRQLDLSLLGLFLVGRQRLVWPSTSLTFHLPRIIAFDASQRHGVKYQEVSDCLHRLSQASGCNCGDQQIWQLLLRFEGSPYAQMQVIYNAGIMMAAGQCCCCSKPLIKQQFGLMLLEVETLAALAADLVARNSRLTIEAATSLMVNETSLSAEAAILCGLAHDYARPAS